MSILIETAFSVYEWDYAANRYRYLSSLHEPTSRQLEHQRPDSWIEVAEVLRVNGAVMFVYGYSESGVAQGTLSSSVQRIQVTDDLDLQMAARLQATRLPESVLNEAKEPDA